MSYNLIPWVSEMTSVVDSSPKQCHQFILLLSPYINYPYNQHTIRYFGTNIVITMP